MAYCQNKRKQKRNGNSNIEPPQPVELTELCRYFGANADTHDDTANRSHKGSPERISNPGLIEQSERIVGQTTLYKFMLSEFGEAVRSIFSDYRVGGCKVVRTAAWPNNSFSVNRRIGEFA